MTVTKSEIAVLIQNDREEAHENACEAYHALEALQRTATWMELPLSVRKALCTAHASLGMLADAIADG